MTTMTTSESCLPNLRVEIDNAYITTKLRSNYGTSSSERSEISEILKLAENDLEDYNLELHRLQMQILTLKFQERQLKNYAEKLHSLRAPIRNLPNELLLEIFLFCCDDASDAYSCDTPTVIVLSTICTRWRQLVNSEPQLWTRFAVRCFEVSAQSTTSTNRRSWDSAVAHAKGYLERTQGRFLSLHIFVDYCGTGVPCRHPGLELLVAQSHRWKNVSFDCEGVLETESGLIANPAIAFPVLETLYIDMRERDLPARLELFECAPRLHALSLAGRVDLSTRCFPWAQITTLELDTGFFEAYDVIAACPNLQVLKISANVENLTHNNYEILEIPCTLNHVVSFSITATHAPDLFENTLLSFTFPSLRSLDLFGFFGVEYPNHELQNFLSRSQSNITLLSLCGLSISDDEAIDLVQQLPSLQKLSLHDSIIGNPFIKSLHAIRPSLHASFQLLVPHLKTLSLVVRKGDDLDANVFVEMALSRWLPNPNYAASVGISCLQSVELVIQSRTKSMKLFSPLDDLERAGMRVVIAKFEEVEKSGRFKQFRANGCLFCHDSF